MNMSVQPQLRFGSYFRITSQAIEKPAHIDVPPENDMSIRVARRLLKAEGVEIRDNEYTKYYNGKDVNSTDWRIFVHDSDNDKVERAFSDPDKLVFQLKTTGDYGRIQLEKPEMMPAAGDTFVPNTIPDGANLALIADTAMGHGKVTITDAIREKVTAQLKAVLGEAFEGFSGVLTDQAQVQVRGSANEITLNVTIPTEKADITA